MIPAPCHQVTLISGFTHFWLELQRLLLTVYWEKDWEEARNQRKDSPNFFLLLPHLSSALLREGSAEAHLGPPPLPVSIHFLLRATFSLLQDSVQKPSPSKEIPLSPGNFSHMHQLRLYQLPITDEAQG